MKLQSTKLSSPLAARYVRNHTLAQYLGVSRMTVWRWQRDPKLKTPSPALINDIEHHDLDAWDAWMRKRRMPRAKAAPR